MAIKNPVYPGEIVREDCLKPLNLSITAEARKLASAAGVVRFGQWQIICFD